MTLPFTRDEFPALFGAHDLVLWPFALVLRLASAAALVLVLPRILVCPAAGGQASRLTDTGAG